MDESTPLKISHDVAQTLQRKVEGLADVERAFVHVDYEDEHDIHEEHKPLYEKKSKKEKENKARPTLRERFMKARKPTADINRME